MEINNEHITLYLQGKLTPEETDAFRREMAVSPEFRKEVEEASYIWMLTGRLQEQKKITDVALRWQSLSSAISFMGSRRRWGRRIGRIAAVMIGVVGISMLYYFLPQTTEEPERAGTQTVTLYSAYGLVSKVLLPDSSVVWLNSGSRLEYPVSFDKQQRIVKLNGEAYFKVSSDLDRRFDVQVRDGICVSAYGTEFNVSAYEDEDGISAVLAKGNIAVSRIGQPEETHLIPGTRALFKGGEAKAEIAEVNVYSLTAWKDGKMVFRRAGMEEIARKLSRHFNVDIELRGRILHEYEYTATFTTQTLTEILNLLALSAPIEWEEIVPVQLQDQTYVKRRIILRSK